jgi:hypothetical protein
MEALAENTNAYARKHKAGEFRRKWKPTTANELRVWLGVLIAMGTFRCKTPSDIWRRHGGVSLHVNGDRSQWRRPVSKAISNNRFFQIKRYFHISPSDREIDSVSDIWWEKLEPLSGLLRENCLKYYRPSSSVTVDEMMIRFSGRGRHTVRMPNKPITEGYKVFTICDHGYTMNWRYHSRVKGISELSLNYREMIGISAPSVAVVYQLAEQSLPYKTHDFIVYMYNLFSTVDLYKKLREIGIGACGTARVQAGRFPIENSNPAKDIPWNTVSGGAVKGSGGLVLAMQWQDNNHVHMLSTTHKLRDKISRSRKRPRFTSSNGPSIRTVFQNKNTIIIPIPVMVDDYNYHKGGVDIADQYRSYFFTQLIARRNWLPFFFWLLDTMIVNAYILYSLSMEKEASKASHKSFRLTLAGQLLQKYVKNEKWTWYKRKTKPIRYSKALGVCDLPPPLLGEGHVKVHIGGRRECDRCRLKLRREGLKGKRAPTSSFSCNLCSFVLCSICFIDYHGGNQDPRAGLL